jgi:hypothetical protein
MKRYRAGTPSSSDLSDNSSDAEPTTKHRRQDLLPQLNDAVLTCQLPPTCDHAPVKFDNVGQLQAHYDRCHVFVCSADACGKVFPDARILDLVSNERYPNKTVRAISLLLDWRI